MLCCVSDLFLIDFVMQSNPGFSFKISINSLLKLFRTESLWAWPTGINNTAVQANKIQASNRLLQSLKPPIQKNPPFYLLRKSL